MSEKNRTEIENLMSTESPDAKDKSPTHFNFIFFKLLIPLAIIALCVSSMVYYALKKRRLDRLRHRLVPFYKFEPGECEDEWQTDLMDEPDNQKTCNKLQDYKTTGSVTE